MEQHLRLEQRMRKVALGGLGCSDKTEDHQCHPANREDPHYPGIERKAEKPHREQEQRRRAEGPTLLFAGQGRQVRLAQRTSSINSRIRRIAFSRPTKTASPIR